MIIRVLATDKDLLTADAGWSTQCRPGKAALLTVDLRDATHYADGVDSMLRFAGGGGGSSIDLMDHPAISHLPETPATESRMTARFLPGQRPAAQLTEIGERIAALSAMAENLSHSLAILATEGRADDGPPVTAAVVRRLIKSRRERDTLFPPGLFADPAWDILLTLVATRLEGGDVSVSSLCHAAAVPTTTGLRWISNLIDQGMLQRLPDPQDARRILIVLADPVFETVLAWVSRFATAFAPR